MSENQNRRDTEFAKYDAMTTEELEELLRLDLEAPPEQESDTEALLHVMKVLAQRRKNDASHTGKTAQEAYESFRQNYMPEEIHTETVPTRRKRIDNKPALRWLRTLTAAAAVLAIILLGSVTAKAFGLDIWEAVVKWTEDTFHISIGDSRDTEDPGKNDDLPYASLEEALEKGEVEVALAPTWIPEGYSLTAIKVEDTPLQKQYTAMYYDKDNFVKITIRHYLNSDPEYIEQSEGLVEVYEAFGITYYIFANYETVRAVWIRDSFECYISGDLSIEELKMMIDSIGKG